MERVIPITELHAPAIAEWEAHAERGARLEDEGEEQKWSAVDEYEKAYEVGATQQQIADVAGKSQPHISYMLITKVIKAENPDFSFAECYARAKGNHNHRAQGTGDNEWYTPAEYIEAARKVMGGIDLDPATSEIAQEYIQADRYFTKEQDGLSQEWGGRVWLNPPFSKELLYPFVKKLVDEATAGHIEQAVLLTHNYTDTAWFHVAEEIAALICFTRGRVKFIDENGEECAPTQGQAFFYFGENRRQFESYFSEYGFIR